MLNTTKSKLSNKEMSNLGWKQIMSIVRSLIDLGGTFNKNNNWMLLLTKLLYFNNGIEGVQ